MSGPDSAGASPFQLWADACLVRDPEAATPQRLLYDGYVAFCAGLTQPVRLMTQTAFGRALGDLLIIAKKDDQGRKIRRGVRLKTFEERMAALTGVMPPPVQSAEPPRSSKLADADIKAFAGQGGITARELRQPIYSVEFDPPGYLGTPMGNANRLLQTAGPLVFLPGAANDTWFGMDSTGRTVTGPLWKVLQAGGVNVADIAAGITATPRPGPRLKKVKTRDGFIPPKGWIGQIECGLEARGRYWVQWSSILGGKGSLPSCIGPLEQQRMRRRWAAEDAGRPFPEQPVLAFFERVIDWFLVPHIRQPGMLWIIFE